MRGIWVFTPWLVVAQQIGTLLREVHPKLNWSRCSVEEGCRQVNAEITLDADLRWLHYVDDYFNCFSGGVSGQGGYWDDKCLSYENDRYQYYCTDHCALEGAGSNYKDGMKTDDDSLSLKYHIQWDFADTMNNRVYLMKDEHLYQTFTLMDSEVAFDVDLSKVPCGLNAAFRFLAMDEDGGMARYPSQKAGAKYGTGFCDASCSRSVRFPGGKDNAEMWQSSPTDPFGGEGYRGACCSEMAVWESNAYSYSLSSSPCTKLGYLECGDPDLCDNRERFSYCADPGCDNSPYRLGNDDFYGLGKDVDTTKPFTVVTRFEEVAVTQFFIQHGKKIVPPGYSETPVTQKIPDTPGLDEDYCNAKPVEFLELDQFVQNGGWGQHNAGLREPMVLAMSIYDDYEYYNLWLDGAQWPTDMTGPGVRRGPCEPIEESDPAYLRRNKRDAAVTFSNIRVGPIGTTVNM